MLSSAVMRLAIVRQHYRPDGDVERDIERALEALLERNVAISLYTRRSPQTRLQLIEPVVCDPFHVGALSRDWGFARAACTLIRRDKPSLVESHERLLCCDVYRADDGVHAVWLEERARHGSAASRLSARPLAARPLSSAHRATDVCEPVAARRDLQIENGEGRDSQPFRAAQSEPARHLQPGRQRALSPWAPRRARANAGTPWHRRRGDRFPVRRARSRAGRRRHGDRCAGPNSRAGPPHRDRRRPRDRPLSPSGARAWNCDACHVPRAANRGAPVFRRRRRLRSTHPLRPVARRHAARDGLRPPGRHQHEVGRGRARARQRRGPRLSFR